MASPSVTYTFTNGTTADATQVNTNFTDLISGMTDGTKDFTINQLTVNGAATFNGAITFGNASGDDLTFNGSVASDVPIKTTATYNFGSATLGLLSLYIGGTSSFTTRLKSAATASYTFTLPPAVPTLTGQTLIMDASATAIFRYADKFTASKTTAYTATGDETIIPCAPASSFTVTLPAASTCTGKQLKIIKTDSDATKIVTIDGNGSETINGATTTTLNTQWECVTIACDGTAWYIINREYSSPWVAYTPTFTGFGTPSSVSFASRRVGDSLHVMGKFTSGTTTGAPGLVTLGFGGTSANVTADTAKVPPSALLNYGGIATFSTTFFGIGWLAPATNLTTVQLSNQISAVSILSSQNANAIAAAGQVITMNITIPIVGWN